MGSRASSAPACIANLYSLHSWLGIGTISLYAIQWVFGFVTFFFPGVVPSVRRSALPRHALFSLFVYVLALATAELGFLEKLTFLETGGLDKYGSWSISRRSSSCCSLPPSSSPQSRQRTWPQLSFAAGIFVDRRLFLKPEFMSSAVSAHHAVARSVDFKNQPAAATAEINAFVEEGCI